MRKFNKKISKRFLTYGTLTAIITAGALGFIGNEYNKNASNINDISSTYEYEDISYEEDYEGMSNYSNERTITQEQVDEFFQPWVDSFEFIVEDGKNVGFITTEALNLYGLISNPDISRLTIWITNVDDGTVVQSDDLIANSIGWDDELEFYFEATGKFNIDVQTKLANGEKYYTRISSDVDATCITDAMYSPWIDSLTEIKSGEDIIGFKSEEEVDFESISTKFVIESIRIEMENAITNEKYYSSIYINDYDYENNIIALFPESGLFNVRIDTSFEMNPEFHLTSTKTEIASNVKVESFSNAFYKPWINSFTEIKDGANTVGFRADEEVLFAPYKDYLKYVYINVYNGTSLEDTIKVDLTDYKPLGTLSYLFKKDGTYKIEVETSWEYDDKGFEFDEITNTILSEGIEGKTADIQTIANNFFQPWIDSFSLIKYDDKVIGFEATEPINLEFVPIDDFISIYVNIQNGLTVVDRIRIYNNGSSTFYYESNKTLEYYFKENGTYDIYVETYYNNVQYLTPLSEGLVVDGGNPTELLNSFYQPWVDTFSEIEKDGNVVGFETSSSIDFSLLPSITGLSIDLVEGEKTIESHHVSREDMESGNVQVYFGHTGTYDILIETEIDSGNLDDEVIMWTPLKAGVNTTNISDVYFSPWIESYAEITDGEDVIGFKVTEPVDLNIFDGNTHISLNGHTEPLDIEDSTFEYYFAENKTTDIKIATQFDGYTYYTTLAEDVYGRTIFSPWTYSFERISYKSKTVGFRTTSPVELEKFDSIIEYVGLEIYKNNSLYETIELKTDGSDDLIDYIFPEDGEYKAKIKATLSGRDYLISLSMGSSYTTSGYGADAFEVHEYEFVDFVNRFSKSWEIEEYNDVAYKVKWKDLYFSSNTLSDFQEAKIEFKNLDTDEVVLTEVVTPSQYNKTTYTFEPEEAGTYSVTATMEFMGGEVHTYSIIESVELTPKKEIPPPPVTESDDDGFMPSLLVILILAAIVISIIMGIIEIKKKKNSKVEKTNEE